MFVARRSLVLARMFHSSKTGIEDVVKNKGKTEEDIYFTRKDKETLKNLMDKLEHAIPEDNSPEILKKHKESLLGILKKHNLRASEALLDDIMTWRQGGF
jgi:hypothetical protein